MAEAVRLDSKASVCQCELQSRTRGLQILEFRLKITI